MTALVAAQGLTYRVGAATLLDDVEFVTQRDSVVAVIGPNGAGKSTLLALLAGDRRPTAGAVTIGGHDLDRLDHSARARLRAVLPQQRRTDVPFTVWEVVAMGRHPHRTDPENSAARDDAVVADALDRCDVGSLAGRVFATLSGGEQARVSLARVLAQQAPLVLLDEPTTALDVAHESAVHRELRRLADGGAGVVAVLHDLNAAATVADRVVVVSGGRIVADGPPREVMRASLLTDVYRQRMRVMEHPFRDAPLILTDD